MPALLILSLLTLTAPAANPPPKCAVVVVQGYTHGPDDVIDKLGKHAIERFKSGPCRLVALEPNISSREFAARFKAAVAPLGLRAGDQVHLAFTGHGSPAAHFNSDPLDALLALKENAGGTDAVTYRKMGEILAATIPAGARITWSATTCYPLFHGWLAQPELAGKFEMCGAAPAHPASLSTNYAGDSGYIAAGWLKVTGYGTGNLRAFHDEGMSHNIVNVVQSGAGALSSVLYARSVLGDAWKKTRKIGETFETYEPAHPFSLLLSKNHGRQDAPLPDWLDRIRMTFNRPPRDCAHCTYEQKLDAIYETTRTIQDAKELAERVKINDLDPYWREKYRNAMSTLKSKSSFEKVRKSREIWSRYFAKWDPFIHRMTQAPDANPDSPLHWQWLKWMSSKETLKDIKAMQAEWNTALQTMSNHLAEPSRAIRDLENVRDILRFHDQATPEQLATFRRIEKCEAKPMVNW